jgi:hypothetical protein
LPSAALAAVTAAVAKVECLPQELDLTYSRVPPRTFEGLRQQPHHCDSIRNIATAAATAANAEDRLLSRDSRCPIATAAALGPAHPTCDREQRRRRRKRDRHRHAAMAWGNLSKDFVRSAEKSQMPE